MKVNIANHDGTIQWDGVYYFALSNYPDISEWELRKLIYLDDYEKHYGRSIQIQCENEQILSVVKQALTLPEKYRNAKVPDKITECTACKYKGCLTTFVSHTATIEKAKSIMRSGKLLSAVRAFNKTAIALVHDKRNAAGDTADYFDYVMFAWGNCQAGDRLVMERMLERMPEEQDLSAYFKPGVRFYFRYNDLIRHPDFIYDGYHSVKIRDEVILSDWLFACIIPENNKMEFENIVPDSIKNKVFYLKNDCKDIWDWSEKVYDFILSIS